MLILNDNDDWRLTWAFRVIVLYSSDNNNHNPNMHTILNFRGT